MNAIVFSWSGSFRDDFDEREERIEGFVEEMRGRETEIGVVTSDEVDEAGEVPNDFVIPHVDDLREVLGALTTKYDKVFFVSDVKAELATANQSGAFTVGFSSGNNEAEELGGVGPNYLVDSFDELEKILELEALD